jgi:hypothetical protein
MDILLINAEPQYTVESRIQSLDALLIDSTRKDFTIITVKRVIISNNKQSLNIKEHIDVQRTRSNTVSINL